MKKEFIFKGNKRDFNKDFEIDKLYQSTYEQFDALGEYIKKRIQRDLLLNGGRKKKYNADDIFEILVNFLEIKYAIIENQATEKKSIVYYIINYDDPAGLYVEFNLKEWINNLSQFIPISSISTTYKDVLFKFENASMATLKSMNIKPLRLPPNHIILANNVIVDFKNLIISRKIKDYPYDFIQKQKYNILPTDLVDPFMLEVVKRIISDWADDKKDHIKYINQLAFAAFDGNGRESYNILKGAGGNGKSAFLSILENIAGEKYTVYMNIDELSNDATLEHVNLSTKLVIGHDMPTDTKLSKNVNGRIKQFITGEPFQINRKYKSTVMCATNGLKIQNTNTDVTFFENSTAMKRRINIFSWTDTNFSELNKETLKFNLDELIDPRNEQSKVFYEAFIAYIIEQYEPFEKFDLPEESRKKTNELFDSNDQVRQYNDWLIEQELNLGTIPTVFNYDIYVDWLRKESPKSIPLKRKTFTNKFFEICKEFDYKKSENARFVRTLSDTDMCLEYLNNYYLTVPIKLTSTNKSVFIKLKNQITDDDLKEFYETLVNGTILDKKVITYKEYMMLKHFINKNDPLAESSFELLKDNKVL